VGLERGPVSLVSTTEELLGRKSSVSGLENRDYGSRGSAALTTRHLQMLTLPSPTSGGRSVGIVRSRAKATGLVKLVTYIACIVGMRSLSSCLLLVYLLASHSKQSEFSKEIRL
jgi:hypothetical protein